MTEGVTVGIVDGEDVGGTVGTLVGDWLIEGAEVGRNVG